MHNTCIYFFLLYLQFPSYTHYLPYIPLLLRISNRKIRLFILKRRIEFFTFSFSLFFRQCYFWNSCFWMVDEMLAFTSIFFSTSRSVLALHFFLSNKLKPESHKSSAVHKRNTINMDVFQFLLSLSLYASLICFQIERIMMMIFFLLLLFVVASFSCFFKGKLPTL